MKPKAARKMKAAHKAKSAAQKARGKRVGATPTTAIRIAPTKVKAKKPVEKRGTQPKPDALDAMIAGSAEALGLAIDPAWHDSIKFNLQLVFRHAALVDEFPLADDAEPAAVFHA